MPKEPQRLGGPRQRPVSCKFCRSRKLRCSRESPCTNCLSRGIACELEKATNEGSATDDNEKVELLQRIRKLEAIVEQSTRLGNATSNNNTTRPTATRTPSALNGQVLGNYQDVARQIQDVTVPTPSERLDRDFAWLESIYDGTDCTVSKALLSMLCKSLGASPSNATD